METILTFVGSYLLSFISTSISNMMKMNAQKHKQLLQLAGLREQSTQAARNDITADKYSKTTRRILAILCISTLVTLIVIMAANGVPIAVETTRTEGGWLIFPERQITEFITLQGVPFLKEYKSIILLIIGLYFGNNHAR